MIVFAAIVPHSPLLVPSIGKEHRDKLSATLAAIAEIEQAIYLAKADTLCIIAPHGSRYPDAFSINLSQKYSATSKLSGIFPPRSRPKATSWSSITCSANYARRTCPSP